MKRIVIIAIVLQIISYAVGITVSAQTIWDTPRTTIKSYQLIFLAVRDEYQLRYAIGGGLPAGTHSVRANFWSTTNVYYDVVFQNPTGIAYLTCNGTYIFEMLDSSGQTIAETQQIKTTKIKNPACRSYENGNLRNDLDIKTDDNKLYYWSPYPGALNYHIYKDGVQYKVNSSSETSYLPLEDGVYTVVAVDGNGNHMASSDFVHGSGGNTGVVGGDNSGGGDGGSGGDGGGGDGGGGDGGGGDGGSGCDACKWLADTLACPAWDTYMGELTDAIKAALPPPPNWDEIAGTFVDHFADYFGPVPVPPSRQEIDQNITPPMPQLDTAVPDADITPDVPSDFDNGPLDTDITSGEEIEIVDESEEFEIYEPNQFIDSDPVGTMVFPKDERNHSGGIKEPDRIDTGYPIPTPQPQQSAQPAPEMPQPTNNGGEMPTPTNSTGNMPTPTSSTGNMPTPKPHEWEF